MANAGSGGSKPTKRSGIPWGIVGLLVATNALVGATVGIERTLVPLLGEREFALSSHVGILSFLLAFSLAKAFSNLFAGRLAEHGGRKRILLIGWVVGIPVPLLLMFASAPHWELVLFANVLLGVNQGFCWSMTLVMKVDLLGEERRGLAAGLNESAGYVAVGVTALFTGYLASLFGLRPLPFVIGIVAVLGGLGLSLFIPETHPNDLERKATGGALLAWLGKYSWRDSRRATLNVAGLVNNFNDGVVWGLFPLLFATALLDTAAIGFLVALYPLVWGFLQLGTGPLSDRIGRRWLIAGGMTVQGLGLVVAVSVSSVLSWSAAMILLGMGTAMAYPTLLSAVGDISPAAERATSLGVYRFWRDLGFAVGALSAGILADLAGLSWAIGVTAGVTFLSGILVTVLVKETKPSFNAGGGWNPHPESPST